MQISLTHRDLAEFDASAFHTKEERDMLYNISKLDVSHNRLTLVRGMQCLTNLTSLDVSHNQIKSLVGLPLKVRRLICNHNDIKTFDGLAALTQLEFIDADNNDLTSLVGLPAVQSLRHLSVAGNRISNCRGLEMVPSVHELNLAFNILKKVEDLSAVRGLKALRVLNLTENPICQSSRNAAAVRMLVPKITSVEGLSEVRAGSVPNSINETQVRGGGSRPSTPHGDRNAISNVSSINQSVNNSRSSTRGRSPAERPLDVGGPLQKVTSPTNESMYRQLLRDMEISRIKHQRGVPQTRSSGVGLNSSRSNSPMVQPENSKVRAKSADALRQNTLDAARHVDPLMKTGVTRRDVARDVSVSYNGRQAPGREASVVNTAASAFEVQRNLEARVGELEKDLKFALRRLEERNNDLDNAKLQIKQLKETIDRQARINAVLADSTRNLSQAAVTDHHESSAQLRPNKGEIGGPRAVQPDSRNPNRSVPGNASEQHRRSGGTSRGAAASRASSREHKPEPVPILRPSNEHTTGAPLLLNSSHASSHAAPSNSSRNVSFGGSQFYSPPPHYKA